MSDYTVEETFQDPEERIKRTINWTSFVGSSSISTATWTQSPADGMLMEESVIVGPRVSAFFSGGSIGQSYKIRCKIVLADGQIGMRSFKIRIREM